MIPKLTRIFLGLSLMSFSLFKESNEKSPVPVENAAESGYTINFNNVAITEYLRFVSRTLNVNFVFDEGDLQFNVTIVSEEPVSAKSIISTLIQVLRVHDLNMVDDGDTVLITTNKAVNQIPTVVSSDIPHSEMTTAPMITRVFRIKNANPTTLATILKPLTSAGALIEISPETRQLVVTDIASNIDNIASLLMSLDAPHTPLEIESYAAKNVSTKDLIILTHQIMAPFTEGNPFILAPQAETNTVYIVSTPYLIERAINAMKELDMPSLESGPIGEQSVFIYKIQKKDMDELIKELKKMDAHLGSSSAFAPLVNAIKNVEPIPQSNSLLFTADSATIEKIKNILTSLDIESSIQKQVAESSFFLYPLQHAKGNKVISQLHKLSRHLKESSYPNNDLIQAISEIKWEEESNSLTLTGTKAAIEELKIIVKHYDEGAASEKTTFFIYKPVNKAPKEIEKQVQEMAADLKSSGLADDDLLDSVSSAKIVSLTNSILFTGTPTAIEKLKQILTTLDTKGSESTGVQNVGSLTFLIYKLKFVTGSQLMASLESFADDLRKQSSLDPELGQTLGSMKYIKETNSILFTGTQATLEKVENLVARFDISGLKSKFSENGPATFTLYKPHYINGEELIAIIHDFEQHLLATGVKDDPFFNTINNLKWIDKTGSILVSGDQNSVTRVMELLQKFDSPQKGADSNIEAIENVSFLVYKLQYHQGGEISDALKLIATELGKNPSSTNKALSEAIKSVQWITVTNSLLVSGEEGILSKLRELISNLDIPLRQVFIEILVIETTLGNTQQFGLQWGGKMQYMNKVAAGTGNVPGVNPTTGNTNFQNPTFENGLNAINATSYPQTTSILPPTSGFDLGVLGDIIMHKGKSFISLGSLVNALQTDNDSVIVLNPKIITQDNHTSSIFVGQNLPYNSSVTTISGGASTSQTGNIEYRDIGVNISVTPVLGNNDIVTLDINLDLSAQIQQANSSATTFQVNGISTTHASMATKVHVPTDNFVALSGMLNDTKTHFRTAIPCLGGLPVIGALFSENDRGDIKDNIIIFLRPHIISSDDDYRALTEHQEVLYKDEAGAPISKEEFDHGLDWVKLPVNESRLFDESELDCTLED